MKYIVAAFRLLIFALGTACHTIAVASAALLGLSPDARLRVQQSWGRMMIWMLGMRVTFEGTFPTEPALYTPNHRAYIDVGLVPSRVLCSMVAKQEIRSWPILGYGAEKAMIVFVSRKDAESRVKTRETMRERLVAGHNVLVFPEGTTYRDGVAEFRRGMFDIAAAENIPVVPIAIEYENPDVAWIGEETFVGHFMRVFGGWSQAVTVRVGPIQRNTDGKELANTTQAWVANACAEMRANWDAKKA